MKRIALVFLVITFLISAAVFAEGQKEAAGAEDGQLRIGMSVPGLQFPFFVIMRDEAEEAAEALNIELLFADARNTAAQQTADLENFIVQGVDGILVSPITTDAIIPVIERAVEAGIPVATVDRKAETDQVLVHVGADNVEGGAAAARYIIEQLGNEGTVIVLEGTPGASAAIDRSEGFMTAIEDSNIEVVASQTADFDRAQAQNVMENLIQVHPDVDAIFGANDEMIIGAIEAMQALGAGDAEEVVTVGFDATPDAFSYMEEGLLDATIDQYPGQQASLALNILADYIRNGVEPESEVIYIAPEPVTEAP